MKNPINATEKTIQKRLRLWPGIVIVSLQWIIRFVIPMVFPADLTNQIGMLGGLLGGLAVIVWWVFFSRAQRFERWFALFLMIGATVLTSKVIDISIATAMMGMMFVLYSVPVLCLAFVTWAVATKGISNKMRQVTLVVTVLLVSGAWTLLRTNGMNGDGQQDFAWRWSATAEEQLLAQKDILENNQPAHIAVDNKKDWPGFRGANRDGITHGERIKTDWTASPPLKIWTRPIGPGCSSFAVHENLFYTQEQRGADEVVSCYNLNTGQAVWKHIDKVRFYESHAGAGPRSTPTLNRGRVYTLGATGILNALDATTGSLVWSRNAATDTKVKVLHWGFSGSPLIVNNVVIVALSGKLAAYDTASGKPRWYGPEGGESYSSPHLATLNGVTQVLMRNNTGTMSFEPMSGKLLWKDPSPNQGRILQPAVTDAGDLLLADETKGVRRVSVSFNHDKWNLKEVWKSDEMKLYFNDFILHKGYAYGFDGPSIACIDIKDGKRMWKGSRYRGWLLLLADQDLLVVLTEKGELALVEANPVHFKELALIPGIKGKTWNHPTLVGNILLVRNAQEMAAYSLQK